MDDSTRAFMEPRFGRDFCRVRLHDDSVAAESARAVNARAYTVGQHIVFGAGQYRAGTGSYRLLAHELTHTLQAGGRVSSGNAEALQVSNPADPSEREAERVAEQVVGDQPQQTDVRIQYPATTLWREADEQLYSAADESSQEKRASWPELGPSAAEYHHAFQSMQAASLQNHDAQVPVEERSSRSVKNLVLAVWRSKDFIEVALIEQIQHVKEEFETFDENKLLSLVRGALLRILSRFIPFVGEALLIKDLADLGINAAETLDEGLRADTDEKKGRVGRILAGVFVAWAISFAVGKLIHTLHRRRSAPKLEIQEEGQVSSPPPALLERRREQLLRRATDRRVRDAVDQLYRPTAQVGSGSTGAAIRHEVKTGELLSPVGHWEKAQGRRENLTKLLRDPSIGSEDKAIVKEILIDLQEGMSQEGPFRSRLKAPSTGKPSIPLGSGD
jgi:hypothetical protein